MTHASDGGGALMVVELLLPEQRVPRCCDGLHAIRRKASCIR